MKYANQEKSDFTVILRFPDSTRAEKSCSYDDNLKVSSNYALSGVIMTVGHRVKSTQN